MNKIYRSIWNPRLGAWTAVSELARKRGKACVCAAGFSIGLTAFSSIAHADATIDNGASLTYSSSQSYGGTLYVNTATLSVVNGTLSADLDINIGNAALSNASIAVTGSNAVLAPGDALNIGVAGSGSLTVADGGVVRASRLNIASLSGAAGILNIGAAAGRPAVAPGTLEAASVVLGAGAGIISFNHDSASYVFSPTISGSGSVNLAAGTTIFDHDQSYSGLTLIHPGATLQLGNGGTAGSIATGVSNNGALVFNRSDDTAYALSITGSGSVTKAGMGVLVLSGRNDYSGGTRVDGGTLSVATSSALGSGPVTVNAVLEFQGGVDAGTRSITNLNGYTTFFGASSAGSAVITNHNESGINFWDTSQGANATITNNDASFTNFRVNTSAGHALITNNRGATFFYQASSAGHAVIDNNTGATYFTDDSSAGSATITNRDGGTSLFVGNSTADGATLVNQASGRVDISAHRGGIGIGSLSGLGRLLLGANVATLGALGTDMQFDGIVSDGGTSGGTGGALIKTGTGALTLTGANKYTGGTSLRQGRLNLGNSSALGTGALSMDDDTTLGFGADGLNIANAIKLTGHSDPVIDTGEFAGTLSGAISGGGFITKQGRGTLTLSGANTYTGATNVAQGTLKAGAPNTFSAASAHSVAAGATLDLAGHGQTVASLTNSGTVSLAGTTAGTMLTINGPYVGNNGVLRLGATLGGTGPSDRLVLNGPMAMASGRTIVQITNLGSLGALTSGNGIEVISAQNGATTTAQTSRDAFSLAGSHVDAGAYEYRLNAGDASGAGENWYLRSTINAVSPANPASPAAPVSPTYPVGLPVVTYRREAALYAALPNQLRQGNLAMLGDLRKRVGDDDVKGAATAPTGSDRRAWARVLSTDIDIQQGGSVSPASKGRLTGFQAGTDLLVMRNWRTGVYVGQLDGDARVNGFASGVSNLSVGRNDLRSQYLGVYGTYTGDSGFYADAVVQAGRHRYTAEPILSFGAAGKGSSLLASIEVGQSFALGASGWSIEPQLQLIHQHVDLGRSLIAGAVVQPQADDGWIARVGVRVKGELDTGIGTLQPYGRLNIYKTSSGTDVARFMNGTSVTDITAPVAGTSTALAGGFTLALNQTTSLYGEIGKLWSSGGDAKVRSGINASMGLRVKW